MTPDARHRREKNEASERPLNQLVVRGVMQGVVVDLKAAQALQPSHAAEQRRIVEDTQIELLFLDIALDQSTDLKARQLLQHNHAAMQMRSGLQGLQEWISADNAPAGNVIRPGKHQQRKCKMQNNTSASRRLSIPKPEAASFPEDGSHIQQCQSLLLRKRRLKALAT